MLKKKRGAKSSKKPNISGSTNSSKNVKSAKQQTPKRVQHGSFERQTSPYKSAPAPQAPRPQNAPNIPNNNPNNAQSNRTHRTKAPKRRKFRGGNYTLYYVLAGIIVLIVLIILANTVLFNCASITVTGNSRYTEQEIADISGLKIGENLLRVNTSSAKNKIVSGLVYIDDAQVKKSFPTQIKITVKEAEKQYLVTDSGVTAAISQGGKIIEHGASDGLPVVKGYDAETMELGAWLKSKTSGKSEIPDKVFRAADKTGLRDITLIDMTDKFDVKVTVEDRVVLELGMADEVEQKFIVAMKLLDSEIGKNEYVTVNLTNPEIVPVRDNSLPQKTNTSSSSSSTSSSSSSVPESSEPDGDTDNPVDTGNNDTSPELPAE